MSEVQLPTIEDLLVWATGKPQNLPIGRITSGSQCPIACYLNEQQTQDTTGSWEVTSDRIGTPDDGRIETPDHLRRVISLVDECPGCASNSYIYPPQFIHICQTVQQQMKKGV